MQFEFYESVTGDIPFADFLEKIPKKDALKLIRLIRIIQKIGLTVAIKQKYVKKLDKNLYEIRSRQGSTIQRGLYFHVANEKYIITHGFTKKTQKTPSNEIAKAKRIRWIYFNRGDHQ